MKAVRIYRFGDAPSLEDIPAPVISADEVLVRVEAAALNPLDTLVASGVAQQFFRIDPPVTLGTDFAGTIEQVGSAVTDLKVGDAVIAWVDAGRGGALAEVAAAPAKACVRRPMNLSAVEGSAIPTAGITAWHALFSSAGLKPRETVLIHAAAGGVGSFAVQFAKLAGARVVATASGDGIALARALGADEVIDHRTQDFTTVGSDIDVVLDLVGGETQARSWPLLRAGARLVSTIQPPDAEVARKHGVEASMFYAKPFADRLDELVSTIADNALKVVIDRTAPLDRFADAWDRLTSGHARGKIVVLP